MFVRIHKKFFAIIYVNVYINMWYLCFSCAIFTKWLYCNIHYL